MEVTDGKVGLLGIALAHGTILTAMIYAVGSISGGHFNPAVSFAAWLQQRLDAHLLAGYVVAQLAAAIGAALCLAMLFPDEVSLSGLGTPALAPNITPIKGILFEAFITFFLVTTILLATRKDGGAGPLTGLVIGATLTAVILFAGPLTGAAANPARFIGPALISGRLTGLVAYVVGPLAGACASAFVTGIILRKPAPVEDEEDEIEEPEMGVELPPKPAPARRAAWPDASPPRPGQSKAEGSAHGPPEVRLRRAYELFEAGQLEVAASLARPLLAEREFSQRARALLIVIEGERA
jgi:aquaporin Z